MKSSAKRKVVVLPVWLGCRLLDDSDASAFEQVLRMSGRFLCWRTLYLTDIDLRIEMHKRYLHHLKELLEEVEGLVVKSKQKTAIVFILTGTVAESRWFRVFSRILEKRLENCFFYKVVMGTWFSTKYYRSQSAPYDYMDLESHKHGAVHLFYNTDAPTAGAHRLVEFINRITGKDLPGKFFPNYSFEDLKKMAWHISRESFNSMSTREGSIPRYPIKNCRPIFQI